MNSNTPKHLHPTPSARRTARLPLSLFPRTPPASADLRPSATAIARAAVLEVLG